MREARPSEESAGFPPQLRARVPHWAGEKGDCSMAAFGKGRKDRGPLSLLFIGFRLVKGSPPGAAIPAGKSCTCCLRGRDVLGAYHLRKWHHDKDAS